MVGVWAVDARENTGQEQPLRLHVIFNNVLYQEGLKSGWGFACLIEGPEKRILFDTGGDGEILLENMQRLGLDPGALDAVVLSHIHADHSGGLASVLRHNPGITVYMPASFAQAFRQEVSALGGVAEGVSAPQQLLPHIYSTGEMGEAPPEQALVLETSQGLVVITGCAHANVAEMAERAIGYRGRNIVLLMGGFHLGASSDAEIGAIIERLQGMGVSRVAPSHCTGERAMRMFREAWGDEFVAGGLGAVISVPR
jgi:7,8-dihydropterin-6-yl-methyl-4-(beta-D-ribofuranosyl)aminobenzene 5'-phosphate synthase